MIPAVRPPRPWPSLLLVGPTGSGKTPLGDEIERRGLLGRRYLHFDFGAQLRSAAAGGSSAFGLTARETEVVRRSLATGALFEAGDMPLIIKIIASFARKRGLTLGERLVLNGLPRHTEQALALAPIVDVGRVVSLEAAAAVIRERIRLDTGGDRAVRMDDTSESVAGRLAEYVARTQPLLDHYRALGVPVSTITVTPAMTAAEMYEVLLELLPEESG